MITPHALKASFAHTLRPDSDGMHTVKYSVTMCKLTALWAKSAWHTLSAAVSVCVLASKGGQLESIPLCPMSSCSSCTTTCSCDASCKEVREQ